MYISVINHMGVLFCDTFIIVTVSVRIALDSFISFIDLSGMCLSRSLMCLQSTVCRLHNS